MTFFSYRKFVEYLPIRYRTYPESYT